MDHMWVVGSNNNLGSTSSHNFTVQAQCSSTQETLLRVKFNKLVLDHRVMDSLQLSRDQVNCYYKYIKRVDHDSFTFEEESHLISDQSPGDDKSLLSCRRSS